jgi:hypothetical protein
VVLRHPLVRGVVRSQRDHQGGADRAHEDRGDEDPDDQLDEGEALVAVGGAGVRAHAALT